MQHKLIYRFASLFIAISLLLGATLLANATAQAAPAKATALTFNPVADAYVLQTSASTNYGMATNLRVDNSPVTRSYLRFVVTGTTIQSAVLRIYANSANPTGFTVMAVANNTWSETGITYSNAPTLGSSIASSKAFGAGVWVSVDVSSYIKTAGTYSLVLTSTNATNTSFGSRHVSGGTNPQLVVTAATSATATATIKATATSTKLPTATATMKPSATSTKPPAPSSTPTAPAATSPPSRSGPLSIIPGSRKPGHRRAFIPIPITPPRWVIYSNSDQNIIKQHIDMMQYGNIQAGICFLVGPGHARPIRVAPDFRCSRRNQLPLGALLRK